MPVSALAMRPVGGWLAIWRARAASNLARSRARRVSNDAGIRSPYSTASRPSTQLAISASASIPRVSTSSSIPAG